MLLLTVLRVGAEEGIVNGKGPKTRRVDDQVQALHRRGSRRSGIYTCIQSLPSFLPSQTTKRRGGSGCGNVGTFPRTGSRGVGRVGPSVSKITRARNQKRPGTSGGSRNQEGEALNRTPSVGIRPRRAAALRAMGRLQKGSAHEPPPENVASACDVARSAAARRGWDAGPAAGTCAASTPLNRPCGYVRGRGVAV